MVEGHVSVRACGFESRSGHFAPTRVAKLVDAQSSEGCAFGRAGSNPVPGTFSRTTPPALQKTEKTAFKCPWCNLEAVNEKFAHLILRVTEKMAKQAGNQVYLASVVSNNSINAQSIIEGLAQVQRPLLISGPCSAESEQQVVGTACEIAKRGAHILRAGIWKPRTRPNGFEGKGAVALEWMVNAREESGLPIATEVANAQHVEACLNAGIDVMWIGARTSVSPFAVQEIADALKGTNVPVFVKNPMHADLSLWLGAIERVRNTVAGPVWAVHRGFSQYGQKEYRNAPMWEIAIGLKMALPELPIICDPSHIAGNRSLLLPVAQKAMDLGMEGLMLETHPNPQDALSDANQQLTPAAFGELIDSLTIRSASVPKISSADLSALRLQMDSIDEQVIELLHTRMDLAREIGLHKWENGMTILQMERWKEVFDTREKWAARAGLSPEFILNFLEQVHKESIRVQNEEMTSKMNRS